MSEHSLMNCEDCQNLTCPRADEWLNWGEDDEDCRFGLMVDDMERPETRTPSDMGCTVNPRDMEIFSVELMEYFHEFVLTKSDTHILALSESPHDCGEGNGWNFVIFACTVEAYAAYAKETYETRPKFKHMVERKYILDKKASDAATRDVYGDITFYETDCMRQVIDVE